jgi:hypothetical protein
MRLTTRTLRTLALGPMLLVMAGPAAADELHGGADADDRRLAPAAGREHVVDTRAGAPFGRNGLGVEFAGTVLVEAWNLNERREWLVGGSAAIWWAVLDRVSLVVEIHATRVYQSPTRNGFVQGLAPVLRWRVRESDQWSAFVELGPGISWSDTRVPPRGTRFNYLALGGGGVTRRLAARSRLVAGFRWVHLSNAGREGRARNPDIESLGPYAGIQLAF